jgi:hypothetical protein
MTATPFNYNKYLIDVLEFIGFILPALPERMELRLAILCIYYAAHYYKVQVVYSHIKQKYISDNKLCPII